MLHVAKPCTGEPACSAPCVQDLGVAHLTNVRERFHGLDDLEGRRAVEARADLVHHKRLDGPGAEHSVYGGAARTVETRTLARMARVAWSNPARCMTEINSKQVE